MKQGEAPQALIAALKDEEARRLSLQAELDRLASLRQSSSLDLQRIEKTIRKRVEDVQGVLGRHIPESRRILKTLLVGRMEFTPIIEADVRGYAFKPFPPSPLRRQRRNERPCGPSAARLPVLERHLPHRWPGDGKGGSDRLQQSHPKDWSPGPGGLLLRGPRRVFTKRKWQWTQQ